MLVGAITSKGLAPGIADHLYGYNQLQILMMWSLVLLKWPPAWRSPSWGSAPALSEF